MTTLRWGILGTGGIARTFTRDLLDAGLTVQAVGSRGEDRARAFAEEFGVPSAHGSYEALAADPEVDVIYVATPHPMHAADAELALRGGKHVLVEKAFTMNEAEAARLVDLGIETGLVVMEAMWTRFLPHMVRIRELLAEGALGEIRAVIADHGQSLPTDPEHRLQNPELGGGALLDLGIYPVSFAWDVLGEPVEVHATATRTPTGVDGSTAVLLRNAEGAVALVHTVLDARSPNTASITGTRARIEIDDTWYQPTSFRLIATDGEVLEAYESRIEGRGMQFEALEIERLVREGHTTSPLMSGRQSVGIMRTLDEIRRQIGLTYPSDVAS
ncbi:Gfo/Idh/MocA family protein [Homoserinibacter sp. YIM 151385]|uniref:Gfo/Idh/MocA family protein n=1 Tax=Homoserinibacter sp. YIM 151385 TaxID=2985506 RepID=UPI0022F063B4|nr:Gfo/Idh/MocA family oxidoreductase [Homoserinibacter sp. YIM 151385]WBU36857.1 Gfo/Idh/MocA family oxidoreductase [Homoserinibacter sp. YIM 151385]